MKNVTKLFFALAITLSCGAFSSSAQIYVNVRPVAPRYVRVESPGPRHVWVGDEWETRGGQYVFVSGHWSEPPQPGMEWGAGHWSHGSHGHSWSAGHWREHGQGDHGEHRGHGDRR